MTLSYVKDGEMFKSVRTGRHWRRIHARADLLGVLVEFVSGPNEHDLWWLVPGYRYHMMVSSEVDHADPLAMALEDAFDEEPI